MTKTKESVISVLTIVAFLALAVIASILYSDDAEQKAKLENNFVWQKVKWTFDVVLSSFPNFINPHIEQNQDAGIYVDIPTGNSLDNSNSEHASAFNIDSTVKVSSGLWSDFKTLLKTEWDRKSTDGNADVVSDFIAADLQDALNLNDETEHVFKILDWRKTESGAEIVYSRKNGEEYKLSLPLKILGNQSLIRK